MEYMKCDNCGKTTKLKARRQSGSVRFPKDWLRNIYMPALGLYVDLCGECQQKAVPKLQPDVVHNDCCDGDEC